MRWTAVMHHQCAIERRKQLYTKPATDTSAPFEITRMLVLVCTQPECRQQERCTADKEYGIPGAACCVPFHHMVTMLPEQSVQSRAFAS